MVLFSPPSKASLSTLDGFLQTLYKPLSLYTKHKSWQIWHFLTAPIIIKYWKFIDVKISLGGLLNEKGPQKALQSF